MEEEALLGGGNLWRRSLLWWGWRAVGGIPWEEARAGCAGDGDEAVKGARR